MKTSDIVKVAVVIAAIAGFFYFTNQAADEDVDETDMQFSQDTTEETERQIEERFRTEVPEGAERAELKARDVEGRALATREVTDSGTNISVLADLADPEQGHFYQAWAAKGQEGDEDFERISLGRLRVAKGGFVTDFTSESDLSEFDQVLISQERTQDSEPEQTVVEGSFD